MARDVKWRLHESNTCLYRPIPPFDFAREMLKRGMLKRIFTGYPMWKLRDERILPVLCVWRYQQCKIPIEKRKMTSNP